MGNDGASTICPMCFHLMTCSCSTLKSPLSIFLLSSKITIVGDFMVLHGAGLQNCRFKFILY